MSGLISRYFPVPSWRNVKERFKKIESYHVEIPKDQEGFIKLIQTAMAAQVREATIALETQQGRVIDGAEQAIRGPLRLGHGMDPGSQLHPRPRGPRLGAPG